MYNIITEVSHTEVIITKLNCTWDLYCFGILHGVEWQFHTYVLGQPISPETKVKKLQVYAV